MKSLMELLTEYLNKTWEITVIEVPNQPKRKEKEDD